MKLSKIAGCLILCSVAVLSIHPVQAKAVELELKATSKIYLDQLNGGDYPFAPIASPSGKYILARTGAGKAFLLSDTYAYFGPLVVTTMGFSGDDQYFIATKTSGYPHPNDETFSYDLKNQRIKALAGDGVFKKTIPNSNLVIMEDYYHHRTYLQDIKTGKVIQEEVTSGFNDTYTKVAASGETWAQVVSDQGVGRDGFVIRAFQVGKKQPLFSKRIEGFDLTEKATLSSGGFELIFHENDAWKIYDLKLNKERCSLQVHQGKVIAEVTVENDIAIGKLCLTSDEFCNLDEPDEFVTWELETCKISRGVLGPQSISLSQVVWLDQDRLLVWSGHDFALFNFKTGSVKTTDSIDGHGNVEATFSKGGREVIGATLAEGHDEPLGMMVYRVPFDSIR